MLWENSFSNTVGKDPTKTTMNSKEGTWIITKYLSRKKSMTNKKRKDWRQNDLISGFEHAYLEVDVKILMFRNYLGFAS